MAVSKNTINQASIGEPRKPTAQLTNSVDGAGDSHRLVASLETRPTGDASDAPTGPAYRSRVMAASAPESIYAHRNDRSVIVFSHAPSRTLWRRRKSSPSGPGVSSKLNIYAV